MTECECEKNLIHIVIFTSKKKNVWKIL